MRVESRRLRSLNVVGPTETGKRENRYIATIRQLPKPSQELEAVHSGHRNVRNHSVEFIFGNNAHTVCTGYRAARRDHPPGGRLERHSELRVDGAAGGATRLLCYRSQKTDPCCTRWWHMPPKAVAADRGTASRARRAAAKLRRSMATSL